MVGIVCAIYVVSSDEFIIFSQKINSYVAASLCCTTLPMPAHWSAKIGQY